MRHRRVAAGIGLSIAVGLGCRRETATDDRTAAKPADVAAPTPAPKSEDESAHHVAYFDRASQAYLLLVTTEHASEPTRPQLAALVRRRLDDGVEVDKLVELVEQPPVMSALAGPDPQTAERIRKLDLLGLAIDVLEIGDDDSIIPAAHLVHPTLIRALDEDARQSLPARRRAILLRAEYRNRDAVRGLRLLQTLARLLAEERDALIYDADTNETMDPATFAERQLRAGVGNVAEQLAFVPFPDPRHGEGFARLSTRGMRRFGSPELELDGLPAQDPVLDRATHLLAALAYRMVRDGEYSPAGYAVEVEDTIDVRVDDAVRAYAGQRVELPECDRCPGHTAVHLVARPPEPHDPVEQVVARVVAPREDGVSAAEHPAWAREAIEDLFGPMPGR